MNKGDNLPRTCAFDKNGASIQRQGVVLPEYLLHEVVALARSAGGAIADIYRSDDISETSKMDSSPLTRADLAGHHVIVEGLTKLTPECPNLSEEGVSIPYSERSTWTRFWLIDPLDGTKEFIKRNGEFTVNIALIEDCTPVLGVVHAPVLGVTYFAKRGAGAFVQRGDGSVLPIQCVLHGESEPVRVVASRSHSDERTAAMLGRLGDHECVSMGSSLKLCLVAEGKAHLYPRLGPTMEWDTAAAHAVVSEAGGIVADSDGNELRYNKPDLHNSEFFVCHKGYRSTLRRLIAGDE